MPVLSYQLFSGRKVSLDETLGLLVRHGIDRVEGWAPQIQDPAATRDALDRHGLAMPTGHVPLPMVEETPDRVIEAARILGIGGVIVPVLDPGERPSDAAGWRAFGGRLDRATAPLRDAGLAIGWHNNDFEFAALPGGTLPIEAIADGFPDLQLELDLCWIHMQGHDPAAWVRRYADRLMAVHLKDVAAPGANADEGGWADIGSGRTPYADILPAVRVAGVKLWVIEHDAPSDQDRFLRTSLAHLKDLEGASA